MTHPDILKMERDGFLGVPEEESKFTSECAECGEAIYPGYDRYVDEDGNEFCTVDCALKGHGISEASSY